MRIEFRGVARALPVVGAISALRAFVHFYPAIIPAGLPVVRDLSVRSSAMWSYPTPRRDDTVETLYPGGAKVKDPYRALEDPDAEETKEFVRQENEVFQGFLKDSPFRTKLHDRLTELFNYERFGCPFRRGAHYYYFHNSGLQPQSVLYRKAALDAPPETFFDPNTLSEDGTISLSTYGFTKDGSFFAYALSSGGSDWVMYHVLGTPQSDDILCHKEPENPDRLFSAMVTDDGRYAVLSISENCDPKNLIRVCDLQKDFDVAGKAAPIFTDVVSEWKAEFGYLTNNGPVFYFETTDCAPRRKIVKFDLEHPELGFVDIVPESPDVLSFSSVVDDNKLVLTYLRDVKHVIKLFDLTTGTPLSPFELPLPTGSIVKSMTGRREDKETFYQFGSFLSPGTIFRYNFETGTQSTFLETKVKGFESAKFQTEQVFYKSADGTKIPMFITSKKGIKRDGATPTLLYAYGGFNIPILPSFSVTWLTFMEKLGGIVAVANIRGGSEYGEDEAAKYLFKEGYTTPKKLAINGGSNGGLLVAACVNQAPELFGCAVADVGVMDLLRFKHFTIGSAWTSDYGDPDATEEEFQNAYRLSPLHNVRRPADGTPYPAMLLVTAEKDDRVVPLHSLKLIATLQHTLPDNPNPLMIRVETKAGHGAGKSTQQMIESNADKFAFIATV
ncbi:hypothetical protein HK405_005988 [Cladochytrium tenue]|nr:hypothetical protein HK405_005988 [Cladochytrium tenue]